MPPRWTRFALTAHITFSVAWLGAVVAYLALALAGRDPQMTRSAYPGMELIGWSVIVPLSLAALVTGLVQALGTQWGLFRYYWIVAKFALTVVATFILLVHMRTVSHVAAEAPATMQASFIVHAAGGIVVLLTTAVLSVYKPWGAIAAARRKLWARSVLIGLAVVIALLAAVHHHGGGALRH